MNPARRARTLKLAAIGTTALLTLTACAEADLPQGPAGKVESKDQDSHKIGKSTFTDYYLIVRTKDGDLVEFEVSHRHYARCYQDSSYPACTERTDRDSRLG